MKCGSAELNITGVALAPAGMINPVDIAAMARAHRLMTPPLRPGAPWKRALQRPLPRKLDL
jgi:hypothetical protein